MKPTQEKPRIARTELTLLGLARALFAGATQVYPQRGLQRAKDRAKFCLRGLAMPQLTRQWFQLLADPRLAAVVRNSPRDSLDDGARALYASYAAARDSLDKRVASFSASMQTRKQELLRDAPAV